MQVETDLSSGLPGFSMVGFVSEQVKEAGDRVRVSLRNCGYTLPTGKITVNIAPADLPKRGMVIDLRHLAEAVTLSRRTVHMVWQNLFWAFIYNLVCIPLAAGVLHIFGINFQITPTWASALMAMSSVSVILNSLRLKWMK